MDVLTSGVSTSTTSIRCALGLSFYANVWGDTLLLVCLLLLTAAFTVVKNAVLRMPMGMELARELVGCAVLVVYLKYPSVNEIMLSGGRCCLVVIAA